MTPRSGQRLTFGLANAPRRWGVMATLTFRDRVMDGRKALRRFQRLMAAHHGPEIHTAWVREYQDRGAVHFHYLWDETILMPEGGIRCYNIVNLKSRGKSRRIMRGALEEKIVAAWCAAVGDTTEEFLAFQRGGIVQLWEGELGASRYFGSYLAKKHQKELPPDAEKSGRWWWIAPAAKPVPVGKGYLSSYHLPYPLSTIFDKEAVMDSVTLNLPPFRSKHLLDYLRKQ